jgi:hypothetical protein
VSAHRRKIKCQVKNCAFFLAQFSLSFLLLATSRNKLLPLSYLLSDAPQSIKCPRNAFCLRFGFAAEISMKYALFDFVVASGCCRIADAVHGWPPNRQLLFVPGPRRRRLQVFGLISSQTARQQLFLNCGRLPLEKKPNITQPKTNLGPSLQGS